MPLITWDETLSVGNAIMDADHKRLVELFNEAHGAVDRTLPRELVEKILSELIAYTEWHFGHEERLMEEHGYDRTEAHRLEHRELADSAKALYEQFVDGDDTVPEALLSFLRNWLTNHIMRTDKRLGDFLDGYQHREF